MVAPGRAKISRIEAERRLDLDLTFAEAIADPNSEGDAPLGPRSAEQAFTERH